jgi:GT2 family glycosyltransferase
MNILSREKIDELKVSIIILNYKNYHDTIACLHSLAEVTYLNAEIVVVDNDSQNDSLKYIYNDLKHSGICSAFIDEGAIGISSEIKENIILVQSANNRGYAAGNNLGIRVALAREAEFVLILNNDTLVEKDFLEPLVKYAEAHKEVGAIGPKVLDVNGNIDHTCARRRPTLISYFFRLGIGRKLFPDNRWIRQHIYKDEYDFQYPFAVDILSGCCMMIKSSVFEKVGLLDENTFLYLEEFIIHEKISNISLISVINPYSIIVHKHGGSTSKISQRSVNKAEKESLKYYLKYYRSCSDFMISVISFFAYWRPKYF